MNQSEDINDLIRRAAADEVPAQEKLAEQLRLDHSGQTTAAVEQFLKATSDTTAFSSQVQDWKAFTKEITDAGKLPMQETVPVRSIFRYRRFTFIRYAAAVVIVIGLAGYIWNTQRGAGKADPESSTFADAVNIPPGKDRAILTLADGSTIVLDSAGNGRIAQQSGSTIVKKEDQIVYESTGANNSTIAVNTMSTPRGGQYRLVLPDGTKVWLNAASSISYPTAFVQNKREVKVQGEVYFEVTKNAKKPFIVNVGEKMKVEVLGTHFNINSYENEASVKTTLLEGSVRIIRAGPTTGVADQNANTVVLKPAEQAQVANAGNEIKVVKQVDLDQTMAWKNGIFNFNGMNVEGVLRQIERWYDVDVVYESRPTAVVFRGEMYRNVHLSDVLEKLQEMSGVQFRMEGKKLIVMKGR